MYFDHGVKGLIPSWELSYPYPQMGYGFVPSRVLHTGVGAIYHNYSTWINASVGGFSLSKKTARRFAGFNLTRMGLCIDRAHIPVAFMGLTYLPTWMADVHCKCRQICQSHGSYGIYFISCSWADYYKFVRLFGGIPLINHKFGVTNQQFGRYNLPKCSAHWAFLLL